MFNDVLVGIRRFASAWGRNLPVDITVAYSGGKDSFSLARGLQLAEYNPRLISIDMQYSGTFCFNIEASAALLGLTSTLINPREMDRSKISLLTKRRLQAFLNLLDKSGTMVTDTFTPCTACYNSKIISLALHLAGTESAIVAFGHHATDAVVSYLKSFIMYYDRWITGNQSFSLSRFERAARYILDEVKKAPTLSQSDAIRLMLSLSLEGKIGTDEPPVQLTKIDERVFKIIRPLYFVSEQTIKEASAGTAHVLNASDCGHTLNGTLSTARDLTKDLFFGDYNTNARMRHFHRLIHQDITKNLKPDGTPIVSVRQHRSALLGASYKANSGVAMKL